MPRRRGNPLRICGSRTTPTGGREAHIPVRRDRRVCDLVAATINLLVELLVRLPRTLLRAALVAGALLAAPDALSAQQSRDDGCSYTTCALTIVPRWNGLAVVRGADGPQVANLGFFWPRDVSAPLRGPSALVPGADSAAAQARQGLRLRRIGAALTDAGALVAAVGAVSAMRAGRIRRSDGVLLGAGGAALGLSVPFQFAADGALSRAVWWYNARFAH